MGATKIFSESKVVIDTNEDIDTTYLQTQADDGWELIQVINSTLGRAFDRYFFKR